MIAVGYICVGSKLIHVEKIMSDTGLHPRGYVSASKRVDKYGFIIIHNISLKGIDIV
jgi:hypothetical protein